MNAVLCLNSGSSSLKFAVFSFPEEQRLAQGAIENIGPQARMWIRNAQNQIIEDRQASLSGAHDCIEAVFSALDKSELSRPLAAGHRIVHGGPVHTAPQSINAGLLDELKQLIPLAPLHLPGQIELIEAISQHYPSLPQVACFDTAFHSAMPEVSRRYPLPRNLWEQGVRHYGFHGLSYEFVLNTLGQEGKGRVIIAHLGNGASMAAVRAGKPVDTSMGMTPTGGFMMSTRSGDLDPGILPYCCRTGRTLTEPENMCKR